MNALIAIKYRPDQALLQQGRECRSGATHGSHTTIRSDD